MTREGHNFIKEISDAYQALERVPQLEVQLQDQEAVIKRQVETIQRLELKLIDASAYTESLNASIRTLEVARDDAEYRFLEADDKITHLVGFLKDQGEAAAKLM